MIYIDLTCMYFSKLKQINININNFINTYSPLLFMLKFKAIPNCDQNTRIL